MSAADDPVAWLASWRALAERAGEWDFPPGQVALVAELVGYAEGLEPEDRQAWLHLGCAVLLAEREGSTWLRADRAEARVAELAPDPARGADLARRARRLLRDGRPSELLGELTSGAPFVRADEQLAVQRTAAAEVALARDLRALLGAEPEPAWKARAVAAALKAIASDPPLHPEQRAALEAILAGGVTLVAGGPGTGKTTLVRRLAEALRALGEPPEALALAAPTGKAAQRLEEAVGAPASTVHRLLGAGWGGARFRYGPGAPLPARVVVLDEASMVEGELMARLVAALAPGTRLVLLGDPDQLPSVGAGAVLRDLLDCAAGQAALPGLRSVTLATPHRTGTGPAGEEVRAFAAALRRGAPDEAPPRALAPADPLPEAGVSLRPAATPAELAAFLQVWWATEGGGDPERAEGAGRVWPLDALGQAGAADPALADLFRRAGRGRLLCLHREGPRGARGLNEALRSLAAPGDRGGVWLPGEPVMVTANDPDRRLWNGDTGLALRVARAGEEPRLSLVFPRGAGRWAAFPPDLLAGRVERAWASTVHKAQGSEAERVALVLPGQDGPLLTREALYTAVTRSRRSVLLVGDLELVRLGAARRQERRTRLREALREAGGS